MMIDANGIGIEADIFDDADGPWVMLSHSGLSEDARIHSTNA